MQNSFVACSAGACPAGRVCCYSSFDLVEFVIDRFALFGAERSEPSGRVQGALPLASRVIPTSVTVFA
ncbi:hypothetical protein [Rhodococcus rhodochrous]|uniref:hypothetical protein n=1 Tax=Rhodococcus rhodochrous TaxID=1829 RepID=UPI0027E29DFD|nr:hypothetical protein [Rhodococcus rhodochrous]